MSDPLRLSLAGLEEGVPRRVETSVPGSDFPDALRDGRVEGPLRVAGALAREDARAVFLGTVAGERALECARCLAPVREGFEAQLEAEGSAEAEALDLRDEVRQAVALEQPLRALCRPDCRGLCPQCRADRNLSSCGHPETLPEARASGPRLIPRRPKG